MRPTTVPFLLLLCASAVAQVPLAPLVPPVDRDVGALAPNLLGNGGFETWHHGAAAASALPPDLWYAQGQTAGLFTQTDVQFTRTLESPELGGSEPYAVELTPANSTKYVSQTLENGLQFRRRTVTFALDVRTAVAMASPTIEVADGVASSSTTRVIVASTTWTRLVVKHRVATAATRLEFRIYPDQRVEVNNAMALVGAHEPLPFVPRRNPEPALRELPLGAVIDWYRPQGFMPVPEGFAIMDGSTITDTESPFFGLATLDLSQQFVRGVTNPALIGTTGGAATVDLQHDHTMDHAHSGGTATGNPGIEVEQGFGAFVPHLSHSHPFTTGAPTSASTGDALGSTSIVPPHVGLLKIMRIK